MTETERRSKQIDRDRRAVEVAAMLLLLGLLGAAEEHAVQAIRIGTSPAQAASAVLNGSAAIYQPGIAQVLASASTAAWMMGYYRSHAVAAQIASGQPVRMGVYRQAIRATPNILQPPAATAPVIQRMLAGVGGPTVVSSRFSAAVARTQPIVNNVVTRVAARLNTITVGGPSIGYPLQQGAHVPTGISTAMQNARIAFEKAGVSNRTSWYIDDRHPSAGTPNTSANAEAIVEAVVGQQYEEGRARGATVASDLIGNDGGGKADAPKKRALWGWTWSSVIDGRRCKYCRKLHGTTAPLDDPLWGQLGPLLHFGCRCSRLERYSIDGKTPTIRRPDFADPDIIHAISMRRSLSAMWQGLPDYV